MLSPATTERFCNDGVGSGNADTEPLVRLARSISTPLCCTATRTPSVLMRPGPASVTGAAIEIVPSKGATQRRTVSTGGDWVDSWSLRSSSSWLVISGSGDGASGMSVAALDVLNVGMFAWFNALK